MHLTEPGAPVEPGGEGVAAVTVVNTESVVRAYRLDLVGAGAWAFVEPRELRLFPEQAGDALVHFRPPKSPDVTAGAHPFAIKVVATDDESVSVVEEGSVSVAPFAAADLMVRPKTVRTSRKGKFRIVVTNTGNAGQHVELSASDLDEIIQIKLARDNLDLQPGESATVALTARTYAKVSKGERLPFTAVAEGPGLATVQDTGALAMAPLVSAWILRAAIALVAVALVVGGFLLTRSNDPKSDAKFATPRETTTTLASGLTTSLLPSETTPAPADTATTAPSADTTTPPPDGGPGPPTTPQSRVTNPPATIPPRAVVPPPTLPATTTTTVPPPQAPFIAFSALNASGHRDIYLTDALGRGPRQLTNDATVDDTPALAPDGSKLVFARGSGVRCRALFTVNTDGSGLAQLPGQPGCVYNPTWSQDGNYIVAVAVNPAGGGLNAALEDIWSYYVPSQVWTRVYAMDNRLVTLDNPDTLRPALSPTWQKTFKGAAITLIANSATGSYWPTVTWTVDPAPGLCPGANNMSCWVNGGIGGRHYSPIFTQDATKLVWIWDPASNGQCKMVWKNNSPDTTTTTIVPSVPCDAAPQMSPDGATIVYRVGGAGSHQIATVKFDGSGVKTITVPGTTDAGIPDW